jgi:hypothetical protein
MKSQRFTAWMLIGLMAWLSGATAAGGTNLSDWALMATIDMDSASGKPVARCELTPEVLDASQPDLRDVRVVGKTEQVGYVVRTQPESTHRVPLPVTLYNRTFVPDRESAITVDFGSKTLKNRVRVTTPGTNFRRGVRVEGSDDGETWKTVRDAAWLFRVQHSDGGTRAYEGDVVAFPENDFRYLRITVLNGEDDKGALEIQDVKAFRHVKTPAETVQVPVVSAKSEQKKTLTHLSLDLGYRNLPLRELKLDFSDANFFRSVTVWGRNQEIRVVRRVVEDSPAHEKAVEEPWQRIADGSIHRFSSEKGTEEALTLSLQGAKYRHIQVRIENRNDPPLNFRVATASRLVPRVEFATASGSRYDLLTGNPQAKAPVYDVGHYIGKLGAQGMATAQLGKLGPNPAHKAKERTVPWSERHKEILWIALLAMALALGFLVYRMAATVRKEGADTADD